MNKEVKEFEELLKLVNPERLDEYGLMIFKGINVLLDYINQLETNRDEAIEYINSLEFEEYGVLFDDGEPTLNYVPNCKEKLLEILRGKE